MAKKKEKKNVKPEIPLDVQQSIMAPSEEKKPVKLAAKKKAEKKEG